MLRSLTNYHGDGQDKRREVLVVGHPVTMLVDGVEEIAERGHQYASKQKLDNKREKKNG